MNQLGYAKSSFVRGLRYNSAAAEFLPTSASPIYTTTLPETVDVVGATGNRLVIPCGMRYTDLVFFGTDAANEIFIARISLWRRATHPGAAGAAAGRAVGWMPVHLSDVTLTLGAKVGAAGSVVLDTEFFCDTAVAVAGGNTDKVKIFSPAGDKFATVQVETDGFELMSVDFKITDAATMNCLHGTH